MTQENQGTGSAVPDNLPAKRKRGRPRKDRSQTQGQVPVTPTSQTPGPVLATPTNQAPGPVLATPTSQAQRQVPATPTPETDKKNQRQRIDPVADTKGDMVGQAVYGVLDGSFDAGYLITVRVGESNTTLKGVVFQPGSSVPVSGSNDVAPHIKMMKRVEVNIPQVDVTTHGHGTSGQSVQFSKRPDLPMGTPAGNTVPRVPPQIPSQSQPQTIQAGQNNTGYVTPSNLPQAEVKTMNSADLPAEVRSGGKDFEKSQPNDILPEHPQPELKGKPASPTKSSKVEHGETVKQAAAIEIKVASLFEAAGAGDEPPNSEPPTKNMLNLFGPAVDDEPGATPQMTAGPTAETIKILQEDQTSQIGERGAVLRQ